MNNTLRAALRVLALAVIGGLLPGLPASAWSPGLSGTVAGGDPGADAPEPSFPAAGQRQFTPEVMLSNEGYGAIRFSPDGASLYFEERLPYLRKSRFDLERDQYRSLSRLSAVDVASGQGRRIGGNEDDRTWFLDQSPGGRHLLFGWLDGDIQKIGLLDRQTGREQRLQVLAPFTSQSISWLAEDVLVLSEQSTVAQRRYIAPLSSESALIRELEERTWQGREASVKVDGSGRYHLAGEAPEAVRMLLIDAGTGEVGVVAEDNFSVSQRPAPAGGRVAWWRRAGAFDGGGVRGVTGTGGSMVTWEPVVFDLARGLHQVPLCEGCSATLLRWSPSGKRVYLGARYRDGDRVGYRHFIYDVDRRMVSDFSVAGLPFEVEHLPITNQPVAPLLWLDDDHLAIGTQASAPGSAGYSWHLVRPDGRVLRELTAGLPAAGEAQPAAVAVAVHDGALVASADSKLWRLGRDGQVRQLASLEEGELAPWCPWQSFGSGACEPLVDAGAGGGESAIVLMQHRDGVATGELAFLDPDSGLLERLAPPDGESRAVAVSVPARTAVYERRSADGDSLLMVRLDGSSSVLHRFNVHLSGVQAPTRILLTRREPDEATDRHDWLLLPPDLRPGERRPLLVFFYPDNEYGRELDEFDLRHVSFLNMSLAAAQGYVVLLASMRIAPPGAPDSSPMREMHGQLIRAAENAVRAGYADPRRWAIIGHSYGGYGVNSVLTQTDRFRAAIALAGPSNMTSSYGGGMQLTRASKVGRDLPFGAIWAENQGRMGAPPWEAIQRYVDNSPVLFADRITTPLMLIHGDWDLVHVNEAEQMFVALMRQGKDAQLVRYWGEPHHPQSPANIIDMWERMDRFLRDHLGPPQPAVH